MTKKKKKGGDFLNKLAKGFESDGKGSKVDVAGMMGMGGSNSDTNQNGMGGLNTSDDKISQMLGLGKKTNTAEYIEEPTTKKSKTKKTKKSKKSNPLDFEDKIKKILE